MPIKPENKKNYPKCWKEIVALIKLLHGDKCQWCHIKNSSIRDGAKIVLTVAHMRHGRNADIQNLRLLCQKCHLQYDKYFAIP